MIDIALALSVQGWMTAEELTYLAETASKSRLIAEVGSWHGRSTCALASFCEGLVFAVDTWHGSPEHAEMIAEHPDGWVFSEFMRNTAGLPICPIQLPSLDAALLMAKIPLRFDMIFIDANHTYKSVKDDIESWRPLLKSTGILCGHDYDPIHWPEIVQAVNEIVPNFRIVPNTTIWTTEAE